MLKSIDLSQINNFFLIYSVVQKMSAAFYFLYVPLIRRDKLNSNKKKLNSSQVPPHHCETLLFFIVMSDIFFCVTGIIWGD